MNGGDGGNERIVRARSSGGIVLNGDWRRSSSRGQHPRQGRRYLFGRGGKNKSDPRTQTHYYTDGCFCVLRAHKQIILQAHNQMALWAIFAIFVAATVAYGRVPTTSARLPLFNKGKKYTLCIGPVNHYATRPNGI